MNAFEFGRLLGEKVAARGDMLKKHLAFVDPSSVLSTLGLRETPPPRSWPDVARNAAQRLSDRRKAKRDGKLSREAEKRLGFRL